MVIAADPAAAVHNPAALAPLEHFKFFSLSAQTLQEINYLNYGLAFPLPGNSALGITYLSRGLNDIPLTDAAFAAAPDLDAALSYTAYRENVYLLTYARAQELWLRPFYWGINAKVLQKTVVDYDEGGGSALNFDLGFYTEPLRELGLGLKVQNILQAGQGNVLWQTGAAERLDQYITLGLANKTFLRNVLFGVEVQKNTAGDAYPGVLHFGVEWHPLESLFLRVGAGQYLLAPDAGDGGFNSLDSYYSAGVGINLFGLRLDYAYCPDKEAADLAAHYFSVAYAGAEPLDKDLPPAAEKHLSSNARQTLSIPETADGTDDPKPQIILKYPTANLTTTQSSLLVSGTLRDAAAYVLNGEEYSGQKINQQIELSVGLNELTVGLPKQPQLHKFKILRLSSFDDISAESQRDNIIAAATLGLMSADYPRRFNPQRAVSRQEIAQIILRLQNNSPQVWRGAFDEIDILSNDGILIGFPDGRLRPDGRLTKGQLALMLARLLELPLREARQHGIVDREHWADPAAAALADTALYSNTDFSPRGETVSRAYLAAMLARLPQVSERIKAMYFYEDLRIELPPRSNYRPKPQPERDLLLFEEAARGGR
ncbi:hypothetical protein NO1_1462 [Candidatus Termititenax aidoneus]|uniref:SLH domain-containing protein n=1 Tax=Termititenax aidoneus TaxID=2218524 RepID=A0A388TCM9_TERA1|nr:hypothetical protein NO1_1462 [Candidatus Termititenax aidoneus]